MVAAGNHTDRLAPFSEAHCSETWAVPCPPRCDLESLSLLLVLLATVLVLVLELKSPFFPQLMAEQCYPLR